jgi:hypothetical protein
MATIHLESGEGNLRPMSMARDSALLIFALVLLACIPSARAPTSAFYKINPSRRLFNTNQTSTAISIDTKLLHHSLLYITTICASLSTAKSHREHSCAAVSALMSLGPIRE